MATGSDKSKPYIPLASLANDGWSKEDEATATCLCGAVQLVFVSPTHMSTRLCIWELSYWPPPTFPSYSESHVSPPL